LKQGSKSICEGIKLLEQVPDADGFTGNYLIFWQAVLNKLKSWSFTSISGKSSYFNMQS